METNIISFYSVHSYINPGITGAVKMTRKDVIDLIERGIKVYTWHWDYDLARFKGKHLVKYSNDINGSYLYIEPYEKKTKNLRHLINYSWIK